MFVVKRKGQVYSIFISKRDFVSQALFNKMKYPK